MKKNVRQTLATAAMSAMVLWSLTGTYTLEFIGRSARPEVVDLDIDSIDIETGDFTAEARSDNKISRLWEVVGSIKGNKIEFEMLNPLSEERMVAVGDIDEDGNFFGRAANTSGEEFDWETTDGTAIKTIT